MTAKRLESRSHWEYTKTRTLSANEALGKQKSLEISCEMQRLRTMGWARKADITGNPQRMCEVRVLAKRLESRNRNEATTKIQFLNTNEALGTAITGNPQQICEFL